jgi:hypothetical protein
MFSGGSQTSCRAHKRDVGVRRQQTAVGLAAAVGVSSSMTIAISKLSVWRTSGPMTEEQAADLGRDEARGWGGGTVFAHWASVPDLERSVASTNSTGYPHPGRDGVGPGSPVHRPRREQRRSSSTTTA